MRGVRARLSLPMLVLPLIDRQVGRRILMLRHPWSPIVRRKHRQVIPLEHTAALLDRRNIGVHLPQQVVGSSRTDRGTEAQRTLLSDH